MIHEGYTFDENNKIILMLLGSKTGLVSNNDMTMASLRSAIIGPLVNLSLSSLFSNLSKIFEEKSIANIILDQVGILNFFVGLINLIPVGNFDGKLILKSTIFYFSKDKDYTIELINVLRRFLIIFSIIIGFFLI